MGTTKILGVHLGHNASVGLLIDGQIKFSIQEERLSGQKNHWGFPHLALRATLSEFNLKPADIDWVAIASKRVPPGLDMQGLLRSYRAQMTVSTAVRNTVLNELVTGPIGSLVRSTRQRFYGSRNEEVRTLLQYGFPPDRIERVEHHTCHAASAYFGLRKGHDDTYLVLTLDGGGDGLCSTVSIGQHGALRRIAETPRGHSLGNIYSRITFLLGFVPWEHEYKLMGMAPYVSNDRAQEVAAVFHKCLQLDPANPLRFRRSVPESTDVIGVRLAKAFKGVRFDHICAGLQRFTEDLMIDWVKASVAATGVRKILCAGGVFMNVKANQKIAALPEVESIDVFPSCGDETNAMGAAYQLFSTHASSRDIAPLQGNFYLGSDISEEHISEVLKRSPFHFEVLDADKVNQKVAELLAGGEIVARCSGRMEFGARALGNRSILADPQNPDVVRVINQMVKKRDFWMPFAPVIRKENMNRYIVDPQQSGSPFMMFTFETTPKRSEFMAAVHGGDLTARAQVIERDWNPDYYDILVEFERLTGRGVLLNTSFNLHGYPIVMGPREAMEVFASSGLQRLVMGNFLVTK